jgi:hypothetical protein
MAEPTWPGLSVADDWCGLSGATALACAVAVCLIGWVATTSPPSFCGNCRNDLAARWALDWVGPFLVGAAIGASLTASSRAELRLSRCCALIAAVMWVAFTGFAHGWW